MTRRDGPGKLIDNEGEVGWAPQNALEVGKATTGCRFGGGHFVARVRVGKRLARMTNGVIVMSQYLLALHKADDAELSEEQLRQVWAGVNALADRMKDAGAFVFKSGLLPAESATVVRQSGEDFLISDGQ